MNHSLISDFAQRLNVPKGYIQMLLDAGLTCEKKLLYWVVKDEYFKRLKTQRDKSCFDIKLDLAVEYDISEDTIKNIIYKKDYLKV